MLSTRMAASVRKVHATEGQRVAAGTLLVSLADDDLQGGLKAAEAGLASAAANARRIQALFAQNAATSAELELAQTQKAQAEAAVSAAKANLAYTQIRAPFAGVVQARRVNDGDFVGPGTPLVELEGQGTAELQGTLSETEAAHLKIGQKVDFEADGKPGNRGAHRAVHRRRSRLPPQRLPRPGPEELRWLPHGHLRPDQGPRLRPRAAARMSRSPAARW